jgi:hypothetical protein
VHKGMMKQGNNNIDIALKELLIKDEVNAIYEFQHEITIMRLASPHMISFRRG